MGNRPALFFAVAAAVVATACLFACSPLDPARPERVVLVVIDTLRADYVSAYRDRVATPNIDELAGRGQIFSNAWSSFHSTTMSMASLFTGRTPSLESGELATPLEWNGVNWGGMRRFGAAEDSRASIPAALPSLAGSLRNAGYWTAAVATNPLTFRPMGYDRGFDEWREVGIGRHDPEAPADPGSRTGAVTNRAVAHLLDARPSDHFFLYVHYMDVHDHILTKLRYADTVKSTDFAVGQLMALFRERDLLDGATVILTSDHGEHIAERHFIEGGPAHFGAPSFDELLRVPLIVAPPVSEDTAAFLRGDDVYRLIRRIAGVEEEPRRPDLDAGELFIAEIFYQVYRKGRWKSYRRRVDGGIHLVDLEEDPGERVDRAESHPDVVARHRARMDELTRRLAARDHAGTRMTDEDERRLRSLGYLE